MGEVYRARDTRLKREVAIKTLPDEFSRDPERLARFQREAEALAALNHPNIAHVYGLEESANTRCIVMELVDGDTLQQRLTRGAIPVEEALQIAKQVAEALEAAHERGIIHRDLKPGNIMLTRDAKVKVLDFGLAKALHEQQPSTLSHSPTMISAASMPGLILGTAAYMSPEQARGKATDRRADIWAFGCIFFELLTVRPAFDGETVADILAKVIQTDPDFSLLAAELPPAIHKLCRLCLHKDPRKRIQDAGTLRVEIEDLISDHAQATHLPLRSKSKFAITAVCIVTVAVASFLLGRSTSTPPKPQVTRLAVVPPEGVYFLDNDAAVVSPNGRRIVFTAADSTNRRSLWLRNLDAASAQQLAGTEDAAYPFWSPDNQSIGFFAAGKLKIIQIGGTPATVCDAKDGRGGT
jgi:serine/threonine protein kinase